MSKSKDEWVGPSAYAKHRGVNLSTVKDWIREGKLEGCIKPGSNGRRKISISLADHVLDGGVDEPLESHGQSSNAQDTSKMSLTKARTAKVALEAKQAQIKYEKLSGSLVDKNDVVKAAKEMGLMTKEALLTLPDRLAPLLASESDISEINHLLTREIDEALRNLSLGNWDFFKGISDES